MGESVSVFIERKTDNGWQMVLPPPDIIIDPDDDDDPYPAWIDTKWMPTKCQFGYYSSNQAPAKPIPLTWGFPKDVSKELYDWLDTCRYSTIGVVHLFFVLNHDWPEDLQEAYAKHFEYMRNLDGDYRAIVGLG